MSSTLAILALAAGPLGLPDFVPVVEAVAPSIVNISTVREFGTHRLSASDDPAAVAEMLDAIGRGDRDALSEGVSLGSGLIVRADGLILTNHHVIEGATEVRVQLSNGTRHTVEVIASDRASDLALLQIHAASNLPVTTMAPTSAVRPGQWVLAIGAPFGLGQSVTAGIVSATGRTLDDGGFIPFIQSDVAITPGNSGGPLFDAEGRVVGINSQVYSQAGNFQGASLAIPMDMAMLVVDELLAHGRVRWGWMGFTLSEPVWRDGSQAGGAVVTAVAPGGPAARAGLEPGDRIVALDESLVRRASELPALIARHMADEDLGFGIIRDGHLLELRARTSEMPAEPTRTLMALAGFGLVVRDLDPSEVRQLALADAGVRVVQVTSGTAASAGFRAGDIVVQVDGQGVEGAADLSRRLRGFGQRPPIPVLVERRGAPVFLPLAVPNPG